MNSRHYHLVDVFTDRAFGGNPLAVFLEGDGLSDALMQAIAKEFNLSETTFVFPPRDPAHDFRVRIFTPADELPMAGHPTVGTVFVLTRAGLVKPASERTTITLEEGVGPIPVTIGKTGKRLSSRCNNRCRRLERPSKTAQGSRSCFRWRRRWSAPICQSRWCRAVCRFCLSR